MCDVQVVRFRATCEMMMMMMVRRLYHGRERGDGANKGEEGCMKTRQTRQSGAYTPTDEQQTNGTTSKRHSKARSPNTRTDRRHSVTNTRIEDG